MLRRHRRLVAEDRELLLLVSETGLIPKLSWLPQLARVDHLDALGVCILEGLLAVEARREANELPDERVVVLLGSQPS